MQATNTEPRLSGEQIERYRADGYLAIQNLLSGAEVGAANRALAELIEDYAAAEENERKAGKLMIEFERGCDVEAHRLDPATLELRVRKFMWFIEYSPALKRLIEPGSAVVALVSQILGADPILFQDMALVNRR